MLDRLVRLLRRLFNALPSGTSKLMRRFLSSTVLLLYAAASSPRKDVNAVPIAANGESR